MIKYFDINAVGRDFVVGDIHGEFHLVTNQLMDLEFDVTKDRLFSVGDLVDRGVDSKASLQWLSKRWLHAVRGNHEQMVIDSIDDPNMAACLYQNGGGWFFGLTEEEQMKYIAAFRKLPYAIEIDTPHGTVGIIHAECPYSDWDRFKANLPTASKQLLATCIWARTKIEYQDDLPVAGLHKLYVGHTPLKEVRELGNVVYLDTGAVFKGGKLTVLKIN